MPETTAGFCEKCTAESTQESSGSYREGLFGHEFKGEARKCPVCSSHVAVLWKQFLGFPVKPVGCYRYKMTGVNFGGTNFISRRVPDDAELIGKTRSGGILTMIVIIAIVAALIYFRSK